MVSFSTKLHCIAFHSIIFYHIPSHSIAFHLVEQGAEHEVEGEVGDRQREPRDGLPLEREPPLVARPAVDEPRAA